MCIIWYKHLYNIKNIIILGTGYNLVPFLMEKKSGTQFRFSVQKNEIVGNGVQYLKDDPYSK